MTPRLTGERLLLRPYMPSDLKSCVNLFTDPEVMKFVGDGVLSWPAATALFQRVFGIYDRDDYDVWAICLREDGEFIGSAEFKPRTGADDFEVVYALGKSHWGRGYASEVTRLILDYGFGALNLPQVTAAVDPDNVVAVHLLEKLGFRRIDTVGEPDSELYIYAADNPRRVADVRADPA
jgi:RimJ/RimL family protein N-acetyltransferase